MLFIDYVPLMLINMAAGLAILAWYIARERDAEAARRFCPGFAMSGTVAILMGVHMCWHWPLPGPYNVAFGEMSVLFGIACAGSALAAGRGWPLTVVGLYAIVAGIAPIIIGEKIISAKLTATPYLAGWAFILTGLAALTAGAALLIPRTAALRVLAAALLTVSAVLWAYVGYGALPQHLDHFKDWQPVIRQPLAMPKAGPAPAPAAAPSPGPAPAPSEKEAPAR